MNERKLRVPPESAGERLDRWLALVMPELSRSRIQSLVKQGAVLVDGSVEKSHHKLHADCEVTVKIPEPCAIERLEPEDLPIDIIYEDDDIVVLNKRPGTVVHPGAGNRRGTIANALLFHCKTLPVIGGEERPGIVHRLDKDTSGVLVAAKNDDAMRRLSEDFKERRVSKEYTAIVWGQLHPLKGTIDAPIGRSSQDRKKMSVRTGEGRDAVTHYLTTELLGELSLVTVKIETGRTHQIRVHLSHVGHPVVGDTTYSRKSGRGLPVPVLRQMLHARRLELIHPGNGKSVVFEAPLPDDMQLLIDSTKRDA